jgi:hypothetical protein
MSGTREFPAGEESYWKIRTYVDGWRAAGVNVLAKCPFRNASHQSSSAQFVYNRGGPR